MTEPRWRDIVPLWVAWSLLLGAAIHALAPRTPMIAAVAIASPLAGYLAGRTRRQHGDNMYNLQENFFYQAAAELKAPDDLRGTWDWLRLNQWKRKDAFDFYQRLKAITIRRYMETREVE